MNSIYCHISDSNWLNNVCYTLSVKTGTLVFAYESKIIVLSKKWDSRSQQSKYSITWSDELPPYDDITAVLCLPIANETDKVKINEFKFKTFQYESMCNKLFAGCCWHSCWIHLRKVSADYDTRSSYHIAAMVSGACAKYSIAQRKESHRRNLCYV